MPPPSIKAWPLCSSQWMKGHKVWLKPKALCAVLPNPRFRRPIGLLLTSAPRLSKPYRYFATFVLLLTYLPRNVLEIGRLCEKLSISCQFRGILNFFNVNEQINHKLIVLRRHIDPSKSFKSDYPQLPEVGQSIIFPPIWVIFG